MITVQEVKKQIELDPDNWVIYLMDFVDDFRYYKDLTAVERPISFTNERYDALLAATVAYLCDEQKLTVPCWIDDVPSCKDPWFVSDMHNLRAIALVESPLPFRIKKIFVLENFLFRV